MFLDAPQGPRQDRFDWLRLPRGFGRALKDKGVTTLWVQGWQVLAYWQAIRAAKRAGLEVWLRGETNDKRAGKSRRILRALFDDVDRFLTIGKSNRRFYETLGIDRFAPAPYCVDNAFFAAQAHEVDRAAERKKWNIPDDAFCLLFVGKLQGKKRPLDLARAQPKDTHILWVGTGELEREVRAAVDPRTSTFAGFLNQSQIARAYVAADALVLPSDAGETWGLVVNEAMACGLPCLISDQCGCVDDLAMRDDLTFRCGDVDDLQRAIRAVMADPPTRADLLRRIDAYAPERTVDTVKRLLDPRGSF